MRKIMIIRADQLYFICAVLVSIPLSALFRSIPQSSRFAWVTHVYSIVYAFIVTKMLYFNSAIWYSMIPSIVVWLIGYVLVTYNIRKRIRLYVLMLTWVLSLGYLGVFHVTCMTNHWLISMIDISTMQMLLTVKLTQFMTDLYRDKLYLEKYPSLLEWIGFIYFLPSFLVGPVLKLDEYQNYARYDTSKDIPGPIWEQLKILGIKSALLGCLTFIGMWKFSLFFTIDPEFSEYSFVLKLLYLYISIVLIRCKYYFVWTLAEIKYVISGASPFVNHKGRNIDILGIEFASNTYGILNAWNISTNLWLKDTVYSLLIELGYSINIGILATNVVSAVWHGFYPGYYLAFIGGGLCTVLGRLWRRRITKYIQSTKSPVVNRYYNYAKIPMMWIVFMFFGGPFVLCDIYYIVDYYNNFKWYGFIIIVIGYCFVLLFARFVKRHEISGNNIQNESGRTKSKKLT